ncbi:ATP-binding protein [Streptomyces sp. NPDC006662]|uniref:ATP-binding protein n=1 Tax=Streptomyces sp. NPDC006662 TaxID=3156902 RepID=UPI00340A77CA
MPLAPPGRAVSAGQRGPEASRTPVAPARAPPRNPRFRGAYSGGTARAGGAAVHDGGMAGLEGVDQPRQRGSAVTVRLTAAVEDEQGLRALEAYGNPADAEVTLPSMPQSASTARRLAQSVVIRYWGLSPQIAEHAVLLVSELVGNAVRHTGARTFGLKMVRRRGWIRVEVRDPSRGLPCLMPVHELDTTGRGLFLVDKLSDRWGADLLPRGKITWFEMRVADR